jgi:Fic-DOC domain mobile mystery protein B
MAASVFNPNRGLVGETPLSDISGLKLRFISTVAALGEAEFANTGRAFAKYMATKPTRRRAPFTTKWMCTLHKEMFGDVWSWAGVPRKSVLNLGVPPHEVDVALRNLSDDIAVWTETNDFTLIHQATSIHHRAVQIHPFLNGNGRWSRLLGNIWLLRHWQAPVRWPEDGFVQSASPIRAEYIRCLKVADDGNIDPLVRLHQRFLE